MFDQARSLESAESYSVPLPPIGAATPQVDEVPDPPADMGTLAAAPGQKCFFCGNSRHPRLKCPARDATCSRKDTTRRFAVEAPLCMWQRSNGCYVESNYMESHPCDNLGCGTTVTD